ncbi:MAG: HU family DNA-binding protein [Calditrichae bacterium]|nr:HU family DNA-binding protein [Calditrichota bacterium]MCB9059280.1 HU family DNA-binding protein [Calditrichia bacterium]
MQEKITFDALINSVADKNQISKTFSHSLIKEMALVIQHGLNRDGVVNLSGFGIFKLHEVPSRPGRDIRTGASITIPAKKKVLFKPEKHLREMINKNFAMLKPQFLENDKNENSKSVELPPEKQENIAELIKEIDNREPVKETKTETAPVFENKPEEVTPEPNNHVVSEKNEQINPLLVPDTKEDSKNRAPIFISIFVILIILLLFWQFSGDDQPEEKIAETKKPVIEKTVEPLKSQPNPKTETQKPPPPIQKKEEIVKAKLHKTSEGDNLWNLAYNYYKDGYLWPLILLENKDKIDDPDFIKKNITLHIPNIKSTQKLSTEEQSKLAQGHLLAYFEYKDSKPDDARNHLFVANKYDTDYVHSRLSEIDESDLQYVKRFSMK